MVNRVIFFGYFVFPLLFHLLGFEVCFVLLEDLSKSSYVVITKYLF